MLSLIATVLAFGYYIGKIYFTSLKLSLQFINIILICWVRFLFWLLFRFPFNLCKFGSAFRTIWVYFRPFFNTISMKVMLALSIDSHCTFFVLIQTYRTYLLFLVLFFDIIKMIMLFFITRIINKLLIKIRL